MKRPALLFALIVAVYFVVQLGAIRSVGLTDDDDYYIPAGISYVDWMGRALTFRKGAWSRAGIDAAFEPNHEHPPVAKYVFGLSSKVFGLVLGPSDGARVGSVLFSTLCAALMLFVCIRHLGERRGFIAGGVAVASLLFLPRFFFHSHAATLDVPVAAMYFLTVTMTLLAERSRGAALWAGVIFGVATATKLNAPFALIGYLLITFLVRRRHGSLPLALASMAIVGPLVFYLLWPWMWFDTVQRVSNYVSFHLNHYGIYLLYFGQVFEKEPNAPWHAPFVMAATTTPIAISALASVGVYFGAPAIIERVRRVVGEDDGLRREGDLMLAAVVHAFFSIAIVAFSGGPKYGGEKLFMPFFPFWCLLAGYGAMRLIEGAESVRQRRAVLAVVGLGLSSALALQLRFGEYALSEYNGLIDGLRGATAIGFERQYYDVAHRDLVEWLNTHAREKTNVHFLPNNWEYERTYNWYRRTGALRGDIQVVKRENEADIIVVTHERRFSRYGDDLRRQIARPILEEKIVDGTPIWTVFEGPRGGAR